MGWGSRKSMINRPDAMTPDAILAAWYGAIRSGDAAALAAIVTDDVEVFWNGDPAVIPWAGAHRGAPAVMAFFATVAKHLEVLSVETLDRIDADGAVIILGRGHWRARATGRDIHARMANVFRFRDGRVAAYHVYNDTAAFVDVL